MVFFKEKQMLRQTGFMHVVILVSVIIFTIFLLTLLHYLNILDLLISDKTNFIVFRISALTSSFIAYILFSCFFWILETAVTDKGVYYKLKPFIKKAKNVEKKRITGFEVVTNHELRQYSGWSIRRGAGRMKGIFMVTGIQGVKIISADGSRIILGTQKPEMFLKGLERMKKYKLKKNG